MKSFTIENMREHAICERHLIFTHLGGGLPTQGERGRTGYTLLSAISNTDKSLSEKNDES